MVFSLEIVGLNSVNQMKYSKRKTFVFVFLSSFIFTLIIFALAITPNFACGCGEIQNGTKLTYLINQVSKTLIGKPVFKK